MTKWLLKVNLELTLLLYGGCIKLYKMSHLIVYSGKYGISPPLVLKDMRVILYLVVNGQ